ncbi:MAG: hypothetical protein ACLVEF_01590 [Bifidobacterium bifidum]
MSQWTERHYLLTDLLLTILVAWMLLSINPSVIYAEGLQLDNRFDRALTIIILIPLIFRRRFPESSALAVAILAALQLLFFEPVSLADILASLVALYSRCCTAVTRHGDGRGSPQYRIPCCSAARSSPLKPGIEASSAC